MSPVPVRTTTAAEGLTGVIEQNPPPRINAISTELLSLIFHLAKSDSGRESDPIRVYDQNLFITRLSAVCFRWRQTAIGDGTLWRNISFSPSPFSTVNCAAEFLRRSRGASLTLMMWNPDSSSASAVVENPTTIHMLNQLGQSADRITDLVAINPPETAIGILTRPATSLVRLNIQTASANIIPFLFGGVMPKLEHLSISNPIGWKIQSFQNLRTLHLTATPSRRWGLSDLLNCIDASPAIRELHLTYFGRFDPETAAESRRIVSLPSLHILRLAFCDSALILGHLEIPPSIVVSVYGYYEHSEDILTCLPKSSRFLRMLRGTEFLTVVFDIERQIFEVDIMGLEGIHLLLGAVPLQGEFDRKWVLRSMTTVMRFTPIYGIKWLTMVVDKYSMPWKVWLSKFNQVSTLEVRCPDPVELLGALTVPNGNIERIICPVLRSLSVERSKRPTADSSLLRECLETRASAGSAISTLNLNDLDWSGIPHEEFEAWGRFINRTQLNMTIGSFTLREDLLLSL